MPKKTKKESVLLISLIIVTVTAFIIVITRTNLSPKSNEPVDISKDNDSIEGLAPTISTIELKEKIYNNKDNITLVDVQDQTDYIKRHLPNSINIPKEEMDTLFTKLPKDHIIIIYSYNDKICQLSTLASNTLIENNYPNVYNYKEGIEAWEKDGNPLIIDNILTEKTVTATNLKEKIDSNQQVRIIDLRSPEDYLSSHIPKSENIPFNNFSNYIQELPKNTEIVFYDSIGNKSKIIYKNLVDLGFTEINILNEGFKSWKNSGYPME